MLNRLFSLWLLGTALVLTVIARLIGRRRGAAAFLRDYEAERFVAGNAAGAGVSHACTGCGRCDETHGSPARLRDFALAGARSGLDVDVALELVAGLGQRELAAAEAACPVHVPLVELVTRARRNGGAQN